MASQWQACGRPGAGPGSFVATVAAGYGKPCRRYSARWRPLRKPHGMRRDPRGRRCRVCGGRRRFWPRSWKPTDRAPTPPPAAVHVEPAGVSHARPPATIPLIEGAAAVVARVVGAVRRQHRAWRFSWPLSWRLSRWRAWWLPLRVSWWQSWRRSWWLWCLSLSRLQRVILALALVDAAIIGERADLVWAMPQTASFFAALGLPVNLRGVHFDRLSATADRRDGELVLIVQGAIANSTAESADVPLLRFAIRNAEHQEIYSWTAAPTHERLSASRRLAFRSELILPPADTRDVEVRFVDHDDSL